MRQIADRGHMHTSRTWTSSSGDLGILTDTEELDDRATYVQQYNHLAKQHGMRILVVDDFDFGQSGDGLASPRKQGWLYRILRSSSSQPTSTTRATTYQAPHHRRSVSDLAHSLMHPRREAPKTLDLQSLIRLSGKSLFYLPTEHAPSGLVLPTCLRATAHHIAQHVTTRGVFRIPGSVRVVNVLFDYYCCTEHGNADITGTVRCANLPAHIQASVHDVASTFKRMLSVLPGGILGSLALFDALVAIHSQLHGDPEFPRTKQTKVRARLIALAIATIDSQFRRDLICAVFGLLSWIGRVAELTPREDEEGRPLPTGDLMGYNALGIVFGPLLLGDMLGLYSMRLATPKAGLLVFPLKTPKTRPDRHKKKPPETKNIDPPTVDKVLIANSIAEMLIVNWRDVVQQMTSLGTHRRKEPPSLASLQNNYLQQSESENFVIRKPQGWDQMWRESKRGEGSQKNGSPEPDTTTLGVPRQRSRNRASSASNRICNRPSTGVLSPTVEESMGDDETFHDALSQMRHSDPSERSALDRDGQDQRVLWSKGTSYGGSFEDVDLFNPRHPLHHDQTIGSIGNKNPEAPVLPAKIKETMGSPRVSLEDVPPRTSSKQRLDLGYPLRATEERTSQNTPDAPAPKESVSIERKNAVRKKHPARERFQRTPQRPIDVEWPGSAIRSLGNPTAISQGSQSWHVEFSSQQGALDAALKAHFEELKQLDSPEQQENPLLSHRSEQELQSTGIKSDLDTPSKRLSDASVENAGQSSEYTYLAENAATEPGKTAPTKDSLSTASMSSTPRQFFAPMRVPPSIAGESMSIQGGLPKVPESGSIQSDQNQQVGEEELADAPTSIAHQRETEDFTQSQSSRSTSLPTEMPRTQTLSDISPSWPRIPKRNHKTPVRSSVSQVASKQGSVKAMAARLESDDSSPARPKSKSRTQSLISHYSQSSPTKTLRSSRSVSTIGHSLRTVSSGHIPSHSRQTSASVSLPIREKGENELRATIGEKAALRAIQLQAERPPRPPDTFHERPELLVNRQTIPQRKPIPEDKGAEASLQNPPSLGTMIPYPEQPPIAQHLNLIRPSSSSSNFRNDVDTFSLFPQSTPTPIPRPRSTTTLHAQIRSLQRQLHFKTEEATQLRRQLDVQEDADVGTLSQQLREAKREAQTWKERAEAAERRVKVFERFAARLRGVREAAEADGQDVAEAFDQGGEENYDKNLAREIEHKTGVGFLRRSSTGYESNSSRRTEDAGVVTARIRKCLHGQGKTDGPSDSPLLASNQETSRVQNADIDERWTRDISQSEVEMWMQAAGGGAKCYGRIGGDPSKEII
ncbi:hypothetical protein FZEAL_10186 [Fusarium zealandicum]|uniref:Rho-GAP domain-containing protein n=1 Tax=Fusarium zealandicum TaxID=1053134 RepID=A0A8H4U4S2_9HYPO|nr:hypothetical protein FZEAL_10186 [Fusarium zealandicum]